MCSIVLVSLVLWHVGWFREVHQICVYYLSSLCEVNSVEYQFLVFDASLVLLAAEVTCNCRQPFSNGEVRLNYLCDLFLKVKLLIFHDTFFFAISQDLAPLLISRVGHFCDSWNALRPRTASKYFWSMIFWCFTQKQASSSSLKMLCVKSLDDTRTHLPSSQQTAPKKDLMKKSLYTDLWFANQIHQLMRCCHTNNAPPMTTTCITTCWMVYQLWSTPLIVPVWNQIRQIPHYW